MHTYIWFVFTHHRRVLKLFSGNITKKYCEDFRNCYLAHTHTHSQTIRFDNLIQITDPVF